MNRWRLLIILAIPLLAMTGLLSTPMRGITVLASRALGGKQGNGDVLDAAIALSGSGRFVAFESEASNLVADDFNEAPDLFVHDRVLRRTEMLPQGDNTYEQWMVISETGRFVAFRSYSSNLVPADTNGAADVFLYDRSKSEIELISVSSEGEQANGDSFATAVSTDGRYVSFYTYADNLLPDVDSKWHTLIRDRVSGMTLPGSVDAAGQPVPSAGGMISSNARYVLFDSGETTVVPGDTNGHVDVFIHDRVLGTTERVSVDSLGGEGNGDSFFLDLTTDGRYVLFVSWGTNLVPVPVSGSQLYRHDRQTGETQLVSVGLNGEAGNGNVSRGEITENGRYVTFSTDADNLILNDTNGWADVFIRDVVFGQTRLISVNVTSGVGNAASDTPALSQHGRVAAFVSSASDLVPVDENGFKDVFIREMWFPTLSSNYEDGAPGSTFALTGTHSVTPTVTVLANNVPLGGIPVAPSGTFAFQLATTQADPGRYTITLDAPFADEAVIIWLDPAAPLRLPEGDGPVLEVPPGIAERVLYFPAVWR